MHMPLDNAEVIRYQRSGDTLYDEGHRDEIKRNVAKRSDASRLAAEKTGKPYFSCALTFPRERAHHTRPRLIYVTQNKYTRGRVRGVRTAWPQQGK